LYADTLQGPPPLIYLAPKQESIVKGESIVKVGARNRIVGKVTSIKKGSLMCLVKVEVPKPIQIGSVMTLESLEDLELKSGDEVEVVVKAVNVLLIRH